MTRTRWAAVSVVAIATVLAGSLAPGSTAGGLPAGADKLLHVAGYAVVAGCASRAVGDLDARQLAVVVFAVAAFGAGVELLQPAVGRDASALDAVANLVGALLGALAVRAGRGH